MRGRLSVANAVLVFGIALLPCGCTRHFFRNRADKEVSAVQASKDVYPQWKIEQYHVYPDPRARFADWTDPDRPPMPPDDPAAWALSPHPQTPGKAGVEKIEGAGYFDLLATWDLENRSQATDDTSIPISSNVGAPGGSGGNLESGYGFSATSGERKPTGIPWCDQKPYLLKVEQAVELGLINSREFQDRREDLYLAALPVTAERFAFAFQFLAAEAAIRERIGSEHPEGGGEPGRNRWVFGTDTGFSKLFSSGALMLFSYANRTFIELTGRGPHTVSEGTLNLDLVQPLLRSGGRAVTLEPLTQTERNLLYEIRDYARFRKEFFVNITAGTGLVHSFGMPVAFRGRNPGIVIGGGAAVVPQVVPGQGGGFGLNPSGLSTPQEGYLPTLLRRAILRIDQQNVASLQNIFRLYKAFEQGGDYSQVNVNQIEQNLLQGEVTVLNDDLIYRNGLDRFKIQLGLPPTIPLELDDTPVRPISLQLRRYQAILDDFNQVRDRSQRLETSAKGGELRGELRKLFTESTLVEGTKFKEKIVGDWGAWEKRDEKEFAAELKKIREERRELLTLQDLLAAKDQALPAEQEARLAELEEQIDLAAFENYLRLYSSEAWKKEQPGRAEREQAALFRALHDYFVRILGKARDERNAAVKQKWPALPPVRVNDIDLVTCDLCEAETIAGQAALANRWDLMNARAQLVDSWRQIAVGANSLLGVFNVRYHLNSVTPNNQAMPFNFNGSRTKHQLFLDGELPLVRILQRNAYRATLMEFQRERRSLMAIEDLILFDVRSEIRQLRATAENYRIQKRQTELSYTTVEQALDNLLQPPTPGAASSASNQAGNAAALTTQVLNAQQSLNRALVQLYSIWINYQTARLSLYRDIESMPLDFRGVWIDEPATYGSGDPGLQRTAEPGSKSGPGIGGAERPEQLPQPERVEPPPVPEANPGG